MDAHRVLSIQADGTWQTRPLGTDGAFEQVLATAVPTPDNPKPDPSDPKTLTTIGLNLPLGSFGAKGRYLGQLLFTATA
jgi:hypothetical protein